MTGYIIPLTTAYNTLISAAIAPIPYFYRFAPSGFDGDAYVVLSSINDSDAGTKQSYDFNVSATIQIFTRAIIADVADDIDVIADKIINAFFPSTNPAKRMGNISLGDNFQIIYSRKDSDVSPEPFEGDTYRYLNRNIIFTHQIFIKQ